MELFKIHHTAFGRLQKVPPKFSERQTVTANRGKDKCESLHMRLRNVFSIIRNVRTENPSFHSRPTEELLWEELFFAIDHHVTLRPRVERLHTPHAPDTNYCRDFYGSVWIYVRRSADLTDSWNDCTTGNNLSFVGIVQVFTDRRATTSKSNATVAWPGHAVLLHFTPALHLLPISNGCTFAGYLSVWSSTDPRAKLEKRIEKHQFEKDWSVVPLSDALMARMEQHARILNCTL